MLGGALLLAALPVFLRAADLGVTVTTFAMGSYVRQTVYGENGQKAAADAAQAVQELENLLSWRIEGSDIQRLNQAGGEEIPVDARTDRALRAAVQVSSLSSGAFTPAILPVSRLWDFDGDPHVPGESELEQALSQVDLEGVARLEDGRAALAQGASLDLGAVGKGAACDAILKSWEKNGVSRGVAAVGGSVGLYGQKPFGRPWTVAVRNPSGEGSLGKLSLPGGCVSTSGSYEKTFLENGRAYHHILDPKTGYPAESGLVSVTVWLDGKGRSDGALTDALATACFVLGLESSPSLLEGFGAEAVFVTDDRRVYVTQGLKDRFSLEDGDYTFS